MALFWKKGDHVITQARLWLSGKVSWWKCGFHGDRAYLVLTVHPPCLFPNSNLSSSSPLCQTLFMFLPILHLRACVILSCPRVVISCIHSYRPLCLSFLLKHYKCSSTRSPLVLVTTSSLRKAVIDVEFLIVVLLQYFMYITTQCRGSHTGVHLHFSPMY